MSSPLTPEPPSDADLSARHEAERLGIAFLLFKDATGGQHIYTLGDSASRKILIGRDLAADVILVWDRKISGLHAELECVGEDWALVDDGLSRNGTFLNGERLPGRCKLRDGDLIRVGDTILLYRKPLIGMRDETEAESRADLASGLLDHETGHVDG
jgi:pSer/pThr/pTyr-binding forkhead associated (FHA) protein